MKEELITLAEENNIDIIGFAKVENYPELVSKYELQLKENKKISFQTGAIEDKAYMKDNFSEFNSIIVIGMQYKLSKDVKKEQVFVSSSSWGLDYHYVLKSKLEILETFLKEKGYNNKIFVDNNSFDERHIAYKAGLGFFGKNHLLINDKLGTNFFIGIILTSAIIEADKPLNKTCYSCNKCIEACPTKALNSEILDTNKCLSYLTQKKGLLKEEEKLFNNCIYGCDICTNICPHNNDIQNSTIFEPSGIEFIEVKEYKSLSNKQWKKIYGKLSCAWRGKNIFERNINIYKEKLEKK